MLLILTGLPYSGKTTMRKEIVSKYDVEVVSIDGILDRENMWREGHPTQDDWNAAYAEAYDSLERLLNEGKNVLFDGNCLKFSERETIRQIAKRTQSDVILVYLKIPIEEIMRRREVNLQTKERGHVDDNLMQTGFDIFEEPREFENPLVYDGTVPVVEWIERFIRLPVTKNR